MRVTISLFTSIVCVSLVAPTWAAGPFPAKGKPGKGNLKVKDTGVVLTPTADTALTNWGIMLCDAQTGATLDGPHILTPKINKQTGAIKKWYY